MSRALLCNPDWDALLDRLGGGEAIEALARETKAFVRPRVISNAIDLLRLLLAYSLEDLSLRGTAAWAEAVGLANLSNVAVLYRLRQCGDWLAALVERAFIAGAPAAAKHGRLIRIVDGTAVPQAGSEARKKNQIWRIHSAFDLPAERFAGFVLTTQKDGETLDRIPVVAGEIRVADRVHMHADHIAAVLEAGGDVVVRTGWKSVGWLDAEGQPFDLIACLRKNAEAGLIDQPIWVRRKNREPLAMRMVAVRKSPQACEIARRNARRQAQQGGHQVSQETLHAADWVIIITSLDPEHFPTNDILDLYRLRWRIELAFKRLKSLIGLKGPPGKDPRSARAYILAHLLMILLLEPLVDAFEDSPHWAND